MWYDSTPFNPIWYFWYTYWPPVGHEYVDFSGISQFRESAVQKLEKKCFSVKILIIILIIMVKAPYFGILKDLLNSFQTSGDGFLRQKTVQ